ncbi:MAG: T9SS type A sorting domain-containing protein [Bacteroidota bacterium]
MQHLPNMKTYYLFFFLFLFGASAISGQNAIWVASGASLTVQSSATVHAQADITNEGTVVGGGSITAAQFIGNSGSIVNPGTSPGCISLAGDFTSGGTVKIELADGAACSNFDQIQVTGNVSLTSQGIIEISFIGGIAPAATTFTIINATGTITGNPMITWPAGYAGTFSIVGGNLGQVSFALLPVELTEFQAQLMDDGSVQLEWQTQSETNNRGFDIEYGTNGLHWSKIGFVAGKGHSLTNNQYTFHHFDPIKGTNYYRLRQIDFNGESEFSNIVSVEIETDGRGFHLYPNPVTDHAVLSLESDVKGEATFLLFDGTGKLVKEQTLSLDVDPFHTNIELLELPTGLYLARVQAGSESWQKRIVVK